MFISKYLYLYLYIFIFQLACITSMSRQTPPDYSITDEPCKLKLSTRGTNRLKHYHRRHIQTEESHTYT